jgi:hypothetical protein
MLDTETGQLKGLILSLEGNNVREFYSQLPRPVLVGIEATESMHWFLSLMDELRIECGHGWRNGRTHAWSGAGFQILVRTEDSTAAPDVLTRTAEGNFR